MQVRWPALKQDMIAILDLGSGENARIARLVRELGVYTEIHPHDIHRAAARAAGAQGRHRNGGPNRIEAWRKSTSIRRSTNGPSGLSWVTKVNRTADLERLATTSRRR